MKNIVLCTMHNVVCLVLQPVLSSELHVRAAKMLVLPFLCASSLSCCFVQDAAILCHAPFILLASCCLGF